MMKVAYITDSGSGFSQEQYAKQGIISFPLQITVDNKTYLDMENIQMKDIIQLFKEKKVFYTSQPVYGYVMDCFRKLKEDGYDQIVAVPICPGLSGTANTLMSLAHQNDLKIDIIDTNVTARLQDYLIKRIKELLENNKTLDDIHIMCDKVIHSAKTLIIPKNLDQLLLSGRLTHLAAAVARILRIIPVLEISEKTHGKIDILKKIRTFGKALQAGIETIAESNPDEKTNIYIAHVDNINEANNIFMTLKELFPKAMIKVIELPNVVACHVGPGSISLQWFKCF